MDCSYSLNIGDEVVEIDVSDIERIKKGQAKRLLTYYKLFLKANIITSGDPQKEKLLDRIVYSLSDEGIADMMVKIKDNKGKNEVINSVNELMDAYSDEDFDDFIDEEINGNLFTYAKTLNIDSFRHKLNDIGKEIKGKKWRIELDTAGEVVLCE